MNDTHPQRSVLWPALRRFWPVALLTAVVSGLAAALLVEATSRPSVVADAAYVVPVAPPVAPLAEDEVPPPPSTLPTSPGAAADYAEVYAVLLREDATVLQALATAAGIETTEVPERLQALVVPGGSVVRVSVTGDDRAQADAMLGALDAVLTSPTAVTPNIPPGNLVPLNRGAVLESEGLAPLAPYIGVLVGLLLGIGAAVVLERGDSRFRSGADVRALVRWPVLPVSDEPADPRAEVLVERVRRGGPSVRTVAVVAPRGTRPDELDDITDALAEADRAHDPLEWTIGGVLRGDGGTEQTAQDADAIVLVIPAAARMRHVTHAVQAVEDLAVEPVVVATTPRRRRGRRRPAGGAGQRELSPYRDWDAEAAGAGPSADGARPLDDPFPPGSAGSTAGTTAGTTAGSPAGFSAGASAERPTPGPVPAVERPVEDGAFQPTDPRDEETWPPRDTLSGSR